MAEDEKFVKGAQSGEAKADGGSCHLVFHELKEIGAKFIGETVAPRAEAFAAPFTEGGESVFVVRECSGRDVFFDGEEFEEGLCLCVGSGGAHVHCGQVPKNSSSW